MENASKALLIAAAVLVVILLIAFTMRIFNSPGQVSQEARRSRRSYSICNSRCKSRSNFSNDRLPR